MNLIIIMTMFWYKLVGILLKKLHLGMGINSSTDNPSPVHGYIEFCRLKLNDWKRYCY